MLKKTGKRKKHQLFRPDEIAITISQALTRDLGSIKLQESMNQAALTRLIATQQASTLKKYCRSDASSKDGLELEAFEKFVSINERLGAIKFKFPERLSSASTDTDRVLSRARSLCRAVLGPFSSEEWFQECKNSSGSSLGVSFSDTSPERKFRFPISVTSSAKPIFESYLYWDNCLRRSIEELNRDIALASRYEIRDSSRATTVDKTNDTRRMIAIEPTANMFLQQGLMEIMYKRLASHGLDVKTLPAHHTQLAWRASITARLATIDFSSASDCVHTELLRWLLPSDWFRALNTVRCHTMEINSTVLHLNMFSTMGNATTFPLETLVFWSLAVATNSLGKMPLNSTLVGESLKHSCSVFGDDCIIPSDIAEDFMSYAESVGFSVNRQKSFWANTDRFRESCGGDYLAGCDVRPLYIKRPTSDRLSSLEPWLYIILNRSIKLYRRVYGDLGYIYDRSLFQTILDIFSAYKLRVKLVPDWYPDDSGLKLDGDQPRWYHCYSADYATITRSHHGTLTFQYLRFRYMESLETNDSIRYYTWLKLPRISSIYDPIVDSLKSRPIRRRGGYVVEKSQTSHWDVRITRNP